jgi:hypothetical protein
MACHHGGDITFMTFRVSETPPATGDARDHLIGHLSRGAIHARR